MSCSKSSFKKEVYSTTALTQEKLMKKIKNSLMVHQKQLKKEEDFSSAQWLRLHVSSSREHGFSQGTNISRMWYGFLTKKATILNTNNKQNPKLVIEEIINIRAKINKMRLKNRNYQFLNILLQKS